MGIKRSLWISEMLAMPLIWCHMCFLSEKWENKQNISFLDFLCILLSGFSVPKRNYRQKLCDAWRKRKTSQWSQYTNANKMTWVFRKMLVFPIKHCPTISEYLCSCVSCPIFPIIPTFVLCPIFLPKLLI